MTDLEAYYNKFNEEKRLDSRHGRVEFVTSMHYIHQCLDEIVKERAKEEIHILGIGAGTGPVISVTSAPRRIQFSAIA